MSRLPCRL